jgi:hypothetical protein
MRRQLASPLLSPIRPDPPQPGDATTANEAAGRTCYNMSAEPAVNDARSAPCHRLSVMPEKRRLPLLLIQLNAGYLIIQLQSGVFRRMNPRTAL